jgi:hypothetical protein
MGRRIEVGGNLESEHPTRSSSCEKPGYGGLVIRHPLQSGVGEDDLEEPGFGVCPCGNFTLDPLMLWLFALRFANHCSGIVHTGDFGVRPEFCQNLGAIARSAPQVDNAPSPFDEDSSGKITARPCPLFREFEILIGIPARHWAYMISRLSDHTPAPNRLINVVSETTGLVPIFD